MTIVDPAVAPPGLSRIDRYQPVLLLTSVAGGLGLAKFARSLGGSLSTLVTVGVVALIYLVMLQLDFKQVAVSFRERTFLTVAVVVNFVVNPVLAWAMGAVFLQEHPDLRIGLILFLVTPCIGWYLIFTELAGGDAALGLSLLGVNLFLQILLLPLYLGVLAGSSNTVDLGGVIESLALYLLAPGLAAIATKRTLGPGATTRLVSTVADLHLKTLSLVVVIVAMFGAHGDVLFDNPRVLFRVLPPMVGFFALSFGIAIAAGRAAGLPYDQSALLVFTATSRNSEASLAIAATAFASPHVALVVVIGPVVELPLLVVMVQILTRFVAPTATQQRVPTSSPGASASLRP